MSEHPKLIRDFASEVVGRTIKNLSTKYNQHARGQLASYANGVLDCALKLGAICQSENQAAQLALKGEELPHSSEYWW